MAKNSYIKYLVYSILFLLIYFIVSYIIYYGYLNNEDQSAFLGTFIGGMFAGIFAIFGVILTLDYQQFKQESEVISHKNMLVTQLKFTHEFISNLPSKGSDSLYGGLLVYDPDWHKHLQYINLNEDEFRKIVDWIYLMHQIEKVANRNLDGNIAADSILKTFDTTERLLNIKKMIEKLSTS